MNDGPSYSIDHSERIVSELEEKTAEEIRVIDRDWRSAVEAIVRKASAAEAEWRREFALRSRAAVDGLKELRNRNLRSETNRKLMVLKEADVRLILEITRRRFLEVTAGIEYPRLLEYFIRDGVGVLGAELRRARVNGRDATVVRGLLEAAGAGPVRIETDPSLDGVVMSDESGHMIRDNSLEGYWRRMKDSLLQFINREIDRRMPAGRAGPLDRAGGKDPV